MIQPLLPMALDHTNMEAAQPDVDLLQVSVHNARG